MHVSHDIFIEQNARNLDENMHGTLDSLAVAQPLSNVAPINVTAGIGKLIVMANAGGDSAGVITLTGDTVNRNTGVVTVGNTENITLIGLSTDNSDVDAEGNDRHALVGGYISTNWFRGAVAITTAGGGAGVTLTNTDVYQCSFEQFNDQGGTIETFDINTLCLNVAAWLYAYFYTVIVSGSRVNVTRMSSLEVPAAISVADKYYRLRDDTLSVNLDGTTDGVFIEVFFGPMPQVYWADFSMKLWREVDLEEAFPGTTLLLGTAGLTAQQISQISRTVCQLGGTC